MNRIIDAIKGFYKYFRSQGLSAAFAYTVRSVRLYNLPTTAEFLESDKDQSPRQIDLALVIGESDYEIADHAIRSILNLSINPVRSIRIISQNEKFRLGFTPKVPVTYHLDQDFVSPELLSSIKQKLGARAGWATQQSLKCLLANEADITTVIVDADTVFQKPTLFVQSSGKVLLPCIPSRNPNYDRALSFFGLERRFYDFSYVMHFIVVNPSSTKTRLETLGLYPPSACLETILSLNSNDFGVDYELIGELTYRSDPLYRELVKVRNKTGLRKDINTREASFDSISFHHYAQG